MDSVRVLCVENYAEYRDALKYMLEQAGYEVTSATTGKQGLAMFASQYFHGVLLEYDLPDATGSTIRSEMKRMKPEVPVLLFAGIGSQTPFLLRFFDSFIRNADKPDWALRDLDG
ncbi:MAG TPA: response regulator [Candidatus Acidoferrum sp.]|nr:response regulator [Candidatus Acidoferrum sp.]